MWPSLVSGLKWRTTIAGRMIATTVSIWENLYQLFMVCVQYIPRNMHTVFALLCFVVVMHWLIFPYPSGLLHWHCGNLTIGPVPAKKPWWIWINTSCEFIMNDCITTTKQSTTKPRAYFLGYTVRNNIHCDRHHSRNHLVTKMCVSHKVSLSFIFTPFSEVNR